MTSSEALKAIDDFPSLVAYLRDKLDWEIPEDLPLDKLTYSYTAAELGLKLEAQVEITQLRPILRQQNPWGVFFVDFDKAELPVTLLRRILSSVSRRKRESANPGDRALFDKNDLLFVSAFGKADDRRLALAHFHQEPESAALPTLRVLAWDRQDTPRHMATVTERLERLRWPDGRQLEEAWKARWAGAFVDRPRDGIRTAKEMAEALAECAKQIRQAIQEILPKERPGQPLGQLFEAVKATLNKDLDVPKFADTYAQTIAYGLLSKRIDQVQRWRAEKARTLNVALPLPSITVDALETAIPTNPFLSELLNSFLAAGGRDRAGAALDFDELGLGDVIDLLNTANMEAVLDDFDKDKQGDDPVIHFYEGFLAAYDKALKVQRGVFYTPKPVVSFIVRSVDEVLRTEFGLPLGLADTATWGQFVAAHPGTKIPQGAKAEDPFVKILDPATGTGTFLVEVIDLIHRRMTEEAWKGKPVPEKRALWNAYVANHLLPRLYGYELMMAPYAVAHMKIGLKLADTGYDFSGAEAGPDGASRPVRARVFLTNALEPAHDFDMQLAFMSEALAHEASAANAAKRLGVFTAILGNPPYANYGQQDRSAFISGALSEYKIGLNEKKINLDDQFIKFMRIAQIGIQESSVGILSFITNNVYFEGLTHRRMRESLLETFSTATLINLHGDARKREVSPDGSADENVFDIMQGVGIAVLARTPARRTSLKFADLWGTHEKKYSILLGRGVEYRSGTVSPPAYRFSNSGPSDTPESLVYSAWIPLPEIMRGVSGIETKRDEFATDVSLKGLKKRITDFVDGNYSDAQRKEIFGLRDNEWVVSEAVAALRQDRSWERTYVRCLYRIFDPIWLVYDGRIISRPRGTIMASMREENLGIIAPRQTKENFGVVASNIMCMHKIVTAYDRSFMFPLIVEDEEFGRSRSANIDRKFSASMAKAVGLRYGEAAGNHGWRGDLKESFGPRDAFDWIYAVLHSPLYREHYADLLKSEFARVPLPRVRDLFADLIPLGTKLVALHLLDANALPDLLANPKVRFVSNGGEPRLGRSGKEVRRDASGRVYLNDQNWFATVPETAWEHWIGGYQPAQKWLKDRSETGSKDKLKPGRMLTDEDILHYRRMIAALEETGKVMAEIDEVIARHGGWPDAFRGIRD